MVARNLVSLYVSTGRADQASACWLHDGTRRLCIMPSSGPQENPADRGSALVVLGRLRAQRLTGRPYIKVARCYVFLGEPEAALAMLEQAAAERNPGLEMIKVEPSWDSVRQDARFQAVLRQIGVSP